jgi:tRNA threonylcarbamoyladenosine biosynthesis protein TsaE
MHHNKTGSKIELVCKDLLDLDRVAKEIIKFAGVNKIWLFEGEMGAGKTTLIKSICRILGIKDNISSPTFSLVNEYQNGKGEIFYHFDFYRINNEEEAMDIGCDEYFDSGNHCFIEWPSKIPALIPDEYMMVHIKEEADQSRTIDLRMHE